MSVVDPAAFRAAAGRFASGVTVVAARRAGTTTAKTVSAFSSLSLDPPLVGAAIGAGSPLALTLSSGGGFGISVLRADQSRVSDHYATAVDRRGPSPSSGFVAPVRADAPVLDDCLTSFHCTVVDVVRAGDHVLIVGEVLAVGTGPSDATPLVHHSGGYRAVATPPTPGSSAP